MVMCPLKKQKSRENVIQCRCCLKDKPKIFSCRSDNWKMQIINKISFLCVLFHSTLSSALGLSGPDFWPEYWDRRWKICIPTFSRIALLSEKSIKGIIEDQKWSLWVCKGPQFLDAVSSTAEAVPTPNAPSPGATYCKGSAFSLHW